MDMSPYRELFVSEARNHLSAFSELIVHLENTPDDRAAIDELFRHAHSLKGMSATMGYEQIEGIAHLMEDQLGRVRSGDSPLSPAMADLLLEAGDVLARLVSRIDVGSVIFEETTGLVGRLTTFDPSAEAQTDIHTDPQTEVAVTTLEAGASPQHQFRQNDSFKSIRIKTETLDNLVNITGDLITNRYRLAESVRLAEADECLEPLNQLGALLRKLRDEVFKVRMLPFAFIADRFPRMVRDLARKQGKDIQFLLEGKNIELDRGILEEIAEPIVHLLRNAVDHGLESADERLMAGKPPGGTITLTVNRDKDHVEIIITDDGRGMDPPRLKQKALEKGIITSEQAELMTQQESYQLICTPGFSTSTNVTEISGRGVGMDAVRDAVQSLTGVLTIHSQVGQGSRFILRLPITVSIIHALIVRCGPLEIAFPLNVIKRTLELKRSEIIDDSARSTIFLDDSAIVLHNLRQALDLPTESEPEDSLQSIIICDVGGTLLAFSVDSISGQQEIFVRPLRSPLARLRGMSGATISGDGRILFIADAAALV
ncbi:MAG: chemotaxis protein CheA [Desulfuromonadales bacterium]